MIVKPILDGISGQRYFSSSNGSGSGSGSGSGGGDNKKMSLVMIGNPIQRTIAYILFKSN
jgi:hypothetical protein